MVQTTNDGQRERERERDRQTDRKRDTEREFTKVSECEQMPTVIPTLLFL